MNECFRLETLRCTMLQAQDYINVFRYVLCQKNFYKLSEIQRVLTGKQPIVYCTGKHIENGNILCFYNRFYQHDASDIAVTLAVYKTHTLHELCDGPHSLWSLCGQVPNSSWGLRICSLSYALGYSIYKILCFFKSIL